MEVDGVSAKQFFRLTPNLTQFNCGSHGRLPVEVSDYRKSVIDEIDAESDQWFRQTLHRRFNESADLVADTYNCPRPQLTLVENVTLAISCVLHSLKLGKGDSVLLTSETYGAMRLQCETLAHEHGVAMETIDIDFPVSHASVLRQYEAALVGRTCTGRRLAILDHITSPSALLMPLEALIKLCAQHGVLSLVDGAHAPGQLTTKQLDLRRLQPDFYTANLHKWAFVPRTCAFLYVSEPFLDIVRPHVVSFTHEEPFRRRFLYRGTFDGSIIASIPVAFNFSAKLGGEEAIHGYVRPLLRKGVRLVMDRIGGSPLCDEESTPPFMMAFFLGPAFDARLELLQPLSQQPFGTTLYLLLREHGVVCSTLGVVNGRTTIRVSANVFNDLADFQRLADALEAVALRLKETTKEEVEEWLRRDTVNTLDGR